VIAFVPAWTRDGNHSLSYAVSSAGAVIRHGTLQVAVFGAQTDRIYQGTDAFVNFCINGNKQINSLNHRLYCDGYLPASYTFRVDGPPFAKAHKKKRTAHKKHRKH